MKKPARAARLVQDGHLILQFDHLNTRTGNISFGDPRPDEYMRIARGEPLTLDATIKRANVGGTDQTAYL
jgi:hypothetical protein